MITRLRESKPNKIVRVRWAGNPTASAWSAREVFTSPASPRSWIHHRSSRKTRTFSALVVTHRGLLR
eukprot:8523640-Pyramimonas_sp.AAC.1